MAKDLMYQLSDPKELAKFLQGPSVAIAEFVTGYIASEDNDKKLMAGRIVQGALKWNLLTQVGREMLRLREMGKIKEDYLATHKQQINFIELLKFIDDGAPDEEVFVAMKSILLNYRWRGYRKRIYCLLLLASL